MVVYILLSNAKTLLGLFCNSNCIHRCLHITLSFSSNVNIIEWLVLKGVQPGCVRTLVWDLILEPREGWIVTS